MIGSCLTFLLTPLREGRPAILPTILAPPMIISTHAPAGGATPLLRQYLGTGIFLLTPLREGRPCHRRQYVARRNISTHAPAGGATMSIWTRFSNLQDFYSRPCGRGDSANGSSISLRKNFYSRPCGRGDLRRHDGLHRAGMHFYSRPCGRGDWEASGKVLAESCISTHAPAGGATIPLRT